MDTAVEARIVVIKEMDIPRSYRFDDYDAARKRMVARLAEMPIASYGESIPDRDFLEAIDLFTREPYSEHGHLWATGWDLRDMFGVSEETCQAKAAEMLKRELLYGCDCGCRGDWSLDNAGMFERQSISEILDHAEPTMRTIEL